MIVRRTSTGSTRTRVLDARLRSCRFPGCDSTSWLRRATAREDLRGGPGHLIGTPLPGALGNSVILGHRHAWGGPFADLTKLRRGDLIAVETHAPDGSLPIGVFTVTSIRTVAADGLVAVRALSRSSDNPGDRCGRPLRESATRCHGGVGCAEQVGSCARGAAPVFEESGSRYQQRHGARVVRRHRSRSRMADAAAPLRRACARGRRRPARRDRGARDPARYRSPLPALR